jgi:hypothetical protein
MPSKSRRFSQDDPLSRAIAPPPDESPSDKDTRLRAEEAAQKISDAIDEELNRERVAEKKVAKPIKILLLGEFQSLPCRYCG